MAERNVPGHTQLTRIPSRAYSTAATLASWITAALVAQYGAACDHAVRPETEAVSTIEPDRCGRMTATAARMPLTAPRTLIRKARSQSSVARLWIRPLGESTPALLISTSRRPKRSTARATTDSTWAKSLTSASTVSTDPPARRQPGHGRLERRRADVAQHEIGGGLAGQLVRHRGAERAARSGDGHHPSRCRASYQQVSAVDAEHGAGDEGRGVGGQELVGAGQVGRALPSAVGRCAR